jgi:hypothetical protein
MSKAIVFNDDNRCPYVFDDSVTIESGADRLQVRNNGSHDFDIGDMNSLNSTVHEGATAPDDWKGNRYTYDGTTWTEISGWVDPKQAEIDRLEAEVTGLKAEL